MTLKEKLRLASLRAEGLLAQVQQHHNPVKTVTPGMPELLRRAAAEGAVLLENRVLPFPAGSRLSLFGRIQKDSFFTGYGSGGDVNVPYTVSFLEGLRNCDRLMVNETLAAVYERWIASHPASPGLIWGAWPRCHPEMAVPEELVAQARQDSDQAVIFLGRSSGEDRENTLEPGSYYLTEEEKALLSAVTARFPHGVLVLNIGAPMDLSFLEDYSFGAVLIVWQGGMEAGNALADLLCGRVSPSGRLTDTWPRRYEDHPSAGNFGSKGHNEYFEDLYVGYRYFSTFAPEKIRYPFGHGLSYTTFSHAIRHSSPLEFTVTVTNTGGCPGKDTVMLFVEKPQGALKNPARELLAFRKTRLLAPGEQQELTLTATRYQLSSYDDSGAAGHPGCYVLQKGAHRFHVGSHVMQTEFAGDYVSEKTTVIKRCREAAAPAKPFPILSQEQGEPVILSSPARKSDLKQRILSNLPAATELTGDLGWKLSDVAEGKISLEAFTAQLSPEELEAISRGAYTMNSPLGARGNAGVFGGVTESLRQKGIPPITATDGPSGIRLYDSCSLLPIGTALASTFDPGLVEAVYAAVGAEMAARGSDVLLAPGMNLHRNPLCGRNFEYYSEDPCLTGRMAAAAVRGIQSQGAAACPKHFACNNQEFDRTHNDSILSERALRELYLKGFEICVKLAKPKTLMTSYNKINGVWGHYHYDLVQTILRGEWGFEGLILTDWWMRYAPSPEFPALSGNGYRVRSGVDVLMPGARNGADPLRKSDGTLLATYGNEQGITLGEMQAAARHVLRCILSLTNTEETRNEHG